MLRNIMLNESNGSNMSKLIPMAFKMDDDPQELLLHIRKTYISAHLYPQTVYAG